MTTETVVNLAYIVAAVLFIVGLKMLNRQRTARAGNMISGSAMLLAVVVTLLSQGMDYTYIIIGLVVGAVIGAIAALRVAMTSMPEMVALFNGFGGAASLLVAWSEYEKGRWLWLHEVPGPVAVVAIVFAIFIGGVTFSGSLIAYGKLAGKLAGKPLAFFGQQLLDVLIILGAIVCGVMFVMSPTSMYIVFLVLVGLSLVFGIAVALPIGGADMPVVIALLNSCSGLAACAAGFVIDNTVLIVAGSLVGASGLILTSIMCKAMNRSLKNVLLGGLGGTAGTSAAVAGDVKPIDPESAYYILEAASSVIIVPGYGMAVAQAQHAVRQLAQLLEDNGTQVSFGIHPVAGRMPGHMNVLLAEANVPYEQLVEMDEVNRQIDNIDVAIVIGANDVVNPAAREQENCPIYGMPIINADRANSVIVLKRSMASGFAGIDNPLFYRENTRMLFGDAKSSIEALVSQFKE